MKHTASPLLVAFALAVGLGAAAHAETAGSVSTAPDVATELKADRADRTDRAERPDRPATSAAERRKARLDRMFGELAEAQTPERAQRIARHIMRRMTRSGSDTVDHLMVRSAIAMRAENYALALDLLDGVVRMEPDFAEGWNRRATVNFLAGNYGRSIADIEETLKREPRHWGALVGLSVILVSMDRKEQAVEIMDRALKIHPFLEDTRKRRDRYRMELEGTDA